MFSSDYYAESYDTTGYADLKKVIPKDKYNGKEWPTKHRKRDSAFKTYQHTTQSNQNQQLPTTKRDRRQLGNNTDYIHNTYQ